MPAEKKTDVDEGDALGSVPLATRELVEPVVLLPPAVGAAAEGADCAVLVTLLGDEELSGDAVDAEAEAEAETGVEELSAALLTASREARIVVDGSSADDDASDDAAEDAGAGVWLAASDTTGAGPAAVVGAG